MEEVNLKLKEKIIKAYKEIFDISKKYETDMRTAAFMSGVGKVAEPLKTLGLWP